MSIQIWIQETILLICIFSCILIVVAWIRNRLLFCCTFWTVVSCMIMRLTQQELLAGPLMIVMAWRMACCIFDGVWC